MRFRIVASSAAVAGFVFGVLGMIVPGVLATALVGLDLDPVGVVLVRLACAGYVGFGMLAWLVRDATDPAVTRSVSVANGVAWALSAVVLATGVMSGLGTAAAWVMVGMQAAFALGWAVAALDGGLSPSRAAGR